MYININDGGVCKISAASGEGPPNAVPCVYVLESMQGYVLKGVF